MLGLEEMALFSLEKKVQKSEVLRGFNAQSEFSLHIQKQEIACKRKLMKDKKLLPCQSSFYLILLIK